MSTNLIEVPDIRFNGNPFSRYKVFTRGLMGGQRGRTELTGAFPEILFENAPKIERNPAIQNSNFCMPYNKISKRLSHHFLRFSLISIKRIPVALILQTCIRKVIILNRGWFADFRN